MSATEELRELLDERGVEHFDGCENTLWGYEQTSESTGIYRYSADEISGGFVNVWLHHCTPEQAIDATLGSERERELESLAADMFCWLVDYLTPQQVRAWENRLEDLDVPPTWGVRS